MKKTFVMDQIAAWAGPWRVDAPESINVENELLTVRSRLYEIRFPELKALRFVPAADTRFDPGANHHTYDFVTHYAKVALHTGMSQRGPRAAVKKERATPIAFVSKTNSYGFSLQDMRAAAYSKFPLDFELAKAARKAHEMWRDDVLLIGDGTATYDGLYGLFKLTGTCTYTIPNGGALSPLWEDKTPDEKVADMHGVCNEPITNSNGVENPDTLLMPLSAYLDASVTKMGDGDSRSVLDAFLAVRQKIRPGFTVDWSEKLETASGTSARRMVAYEKNAELVARAESVEFEQLQPQVMAFETVTDCHHRSAGVFSPYPKSVCYGDDF